MECAEFSEGLVGGFVGKNTAASYAMRIFEARESAADLAVGLEEKVLYILVLFFVRFVLMIKLCLVFYTFNLSRKLDSSPNKMHFRSKQMFAYIPPSYCVFLYTTDIYSSRFGVN